MAKGFKSGGKDWEIGQSGNPKGRAVGHMKELREVRQLKKMNRLEFEKKLQIYIQKDLVELKNIMLDLKNANAQTNPDRSKLVSALDMIIIKVIITAFERGDASKLNFLIDHICGKIPEKIVEETQKTIKLKYNLNRNDDIEDAIEVKKPKTIRRIGGAKNGNEN